MAEVNWKELLKTIATFGLGALGGMAGEGGMAGGYRGGSGQLPTSNPGKGAWSDFVYPVLTVGGVEANSNSVGTARDPMYAHGRTEAEQAALIKRYEDDFKAKSLPMITSMAAGPKRAAAIQKMNERAREYAVMMTQGEHSYLPFEYMNTPADKTTKVNPVASSSWVGNIRRLSPTQVEVNLNGKPYTYGGTPEEVERFLNSPSLGREIINIKNGAGSSLRKLW